jgi:hypothetical protein
MLLIPKDLNFFHQSRNLEALNTLKKKQIASDNVGIFYTERNLMQSLEHPTNYQQ